MHFLTNSLQFPHKHLSTPVKSKSMDSMVQQFKLTGYPASG